MCDIHIIDDAPFRVNELEIIPIFMKHGILPVIGYRIGNLAYCTDVNFIPESEYHKLANLDALIIGGLRYTPHPTHFSIDEAVAASKIFKPKQTYITHLAHQVKHSTAILPENVQLAYDGLKIELPLQKYAARGILADSTFTTNEFCNQKNIEKDLEL